MSRRTYWGVIPLRGGGNNNIIDGLVVNDVQND